MLAAIFSADNSSRNDANEEETEAAEISPRQVTEEDFLSYIDAANQAASLFDYEIRSSAHQVTGKRAYALVNTIADPQTQLATTYSAEELAFINRLLIAMFEKHNSERMEVMAIVEMDAFKLARPSNRRQSGVDDVQGTQAPADKGLKHGEVEMVLVNLLAGGWLEKSIESFYSLSPKALLELRPWLVETFNDPDAEASEWQRVKFCEACKDIITYGLRCSERTCLLRLHDMCQDAFWRSRRSTDCAKCSTPWTGKAYVGERAVTTTDAYQKGRRRSGHRKSNVVEEVMNEGEEGGEDEDE